MPRRRDPGSAKVVYRTARAGLRVTRGQRRRLIGLLISAGDVWACILELNGWRRARQARPLASYQELCRVLAASGPGTFGDLDSAGARSVLRRYADAWFSAAKRRREGDVTARFPRRRRRMMPVRWYDSTYRLEGRVLQIPVARGCPPLRIRLDRDLPYPAAQVRSVTLLFDAGRLWVDVTADLDAVEKLLLPLTDLDGMDLIRLGEFGDGLGLLGGLQGDLCLEGGGVPLALAGHDAPRDGSVTFDQYNIPSCPVSGVHYSK